MIGAAMGQRGTRAQLDLAVLPRIHGRVIGGVRDIHHERHIGLE